MMNQQAVSTVRNPPPRMLTASETLYSLTHWITSFRTYYRRDSYYKGFLLPAATWDSQQDNYGQEDDVHNRIVVRTALDKSEDLKDFLNTIVGYLPFPYLTQKIVHTYIHTRHLFLSHVSSHIIYKYMASKILEG